ncbi:signal peptidase I [Arthrobacter sp. D2-10]
MRLSLTRNVLLTVGAVLGSLCLIAALAGVLFGIKPLMFKSGSMEPTIATGGLALSVPVPAADIQVGDIVSTENSSGTRITHRVAAVTPADGYAQLTLKGDANDVVDAETYAVTEVDRVFWSAPLLGYAVAWLSSPVALFIGGLLTAYLLYVAFGGRPTRDSHDGSGSDASAPTSGRRARRPGRRRSKHTFRRLTGMTVAGALTLTSGTLLAGAPAWGVFQDEAKAMANFGARTLGLPTLECDDTGGTLLILGSEQIALTWSHNHGPIGSTGYVLTKKIGSTLTTVGDYGPSQTSLIVDPSTISSSTTVRVTYELSAKYQNWRSHVARVEAEYRPRSGLLGLTPASLNCIDT